MSESMSMGLAEPRRKVRYGPNPQGKFTGENENKGKGLLLKMGWKDGQGLGLNKQGIKEPIHLKIQMDSKGLGYSLRADPWNEHNQEFDKILDSLKDLKKITPPTRERTEDEDCESDDEVEVEVEIPKAKKPKNSSVHDYSLHFVKVEVKDKVKEENSENLKAIESEKAFDCEKKSKRKKKSKSSNSKLQKTEYFDNEHEDFDDSKIKIEHVEEEISNESERSESKRSKKHKKEKSKEVTIKEEKVELNQNQSTETEYYVDVEKKRKKKKSKIIEEIEQEHKEEMNQIAEDEIVNQVIEDTVQSAKKKHKKKKSKSNFEGEEKCINIEEQVNTEEKLLKTSSMKDNFKLSSRRKRFVLNPNEVTDVLRLFKGSNLNTLPGYSLY